MIAILALLLSIGNNYKEFIAMRCNRKSTGRVLDILALAMMFTVFARPAIGEKKGVPAETPPPAPCAGWNVNYDVRTAIDVNLDGKADLAAFDNGDYAPSHSALWTAMNNGDGTFSVGKTIPNLDEANSGTPTKHLRMLVDLNGDHIPDVVIFGDAGVWTALAKGDGTYLPLQLGINYFGVQQGWDPARDVLLVVDLNHDGYADIIGFGKDGVWTVIGNGKGMFGTPTPALQKQNFGADQGWTPTKHVRLVADIEHSGFPDIVAFGDQGVWTARSNRDKQGTFANPNLVKQNFGSNQGWTPTKHVRLTAVLNNVGYADIIGFGDEGVWTALSNGDGTFQDPRLVMANFGVAQGWDPAKHVRLMADINNDGKDDIVAFGDQGVWTALSVKHGTLAPPRSDAERDVPGGPMPPPVDPVAGTFEAPKLVLENFGVDQEWSPAKHIRLMADLNADRYLDIVGFGDAGVWTALGNGDGTFQTARFPLDYFACNGRFDFNLESKQTDPNGFPFNPQWRWQFYNSGAVPNAQQCHHFTQFNSDNYPVPSFSDCTDQTDMKNVNLPDGWNLDVCSPNDPFGSTYFPGHLNWFTTTFGTTAGVTPASSGSLSWGDHATDDDYDLSFLVTGSPAMLNGRDTQHVEFDSSETIKYYQDIPWWKGFYEAVNTTECCSSTGVVSTGGKSLPLALLDDANAILTGLFGVDCEHDGCKSEIHPVYTFAARVQDNPDDEVWAMFLRNTGDEGYCSSKMTYAPFTNYTFHLPWRTGMTSVEVLWGANESEFEATPGSTGPEVTYLVGQWVGVTFTLDVPTNRPRIDGELHLKWTPENNAERVSSSRPPVSMASSSNDEKEPDEAGPLRTALDRLSPAQRTQIKEAVAAAKPSTTKLQILPAGKPARALTVAEAPAPHPVVHIGELGPVATEKAAHDAAMIRELCKAGGGSIEGAPANICTQSPH